jgi:hypothetical protein
LKEIDQGQNDKQVLNCKPGWYRSQFHITWSLYNSRLVKTSFKERLYLAKSKKIVAKFFKGTKANNGKQKIINSFKLIKKMFI